MIYKYNKQLVSSAQELRKNMTKEEKHLWYDFLKLLPVTVNRQKNIGNYIVDFFISHKRIVIELDGSQHYESRETEKDAIRTAFLEQYGACVLRIPNNEVNKNFAGVCEYIDLAVKQSLHR